MFTGLIVKLGKVKNISENHIYIDTELEVGATGESIAVNGVCLTVKSIERKGFTADISPETLSSTSLSKIRPGAIVNLERSLTLNSLVGGHMVLGHIDCGIKILEIKKEKGFTKFSFDMPYNLGKYVVLKGSVAIDGISLTVSEIKKDSFCVWIVPETIGNTNLIYRKRGDLVNFEADIVAKYIEKQLLKYKNTSKISDEMLRNEGFL